MLKSVKVGSSIRITAEELDRYIKIPSDRNIDTKFVEKTISANPHFQESKNLKFSSSKHIKYIIPTLNSIEAETLGAIIGDKIEAEEIFSFLREENYEKLLGLFSKIVKENNLSIKQSLILLFIEEGIYNLQVKKQLLLDLISNDNALIILPIPPHLFFSFLEFLREGQIINSDHIIPPHLQEFNEFIIDIDEIDPIKLHEKFKNAEILVIDGMKTKRGVLIRRNVAYLVAQYLDNIKKIYLHNIPNVPKDQNFALINDKNFLAKIVDM